MLYIVFIYVCEQKLFLMHAYEEIIGLSKYQWLDTFF